jgi:hypothetical protein
VPSDFQWQDRRISFEPLQFSCHLKCFPANQSNNATVFPKRFEAFIKVLTVSALSYCLPVMAQEQNAWQLGTLAANSSVSQPDDQQVYQILLKMLDRWNAHDIEGYLEVYWKSPELLVVVDSEQFIGWQ